MENKRKMKCVLLADVIICLLICLGARWFQTYIPTAAVQNKLVSGDSTWKKQEGTYCIVYYQAQAQEEADTTIRMADSYFPMVQKDFQWNRKEKIPFVLYQSKKEMAEALDFAIERPVPMGAYYQGKIAILSPSLWTERKQSWETTEDFLENGPIVHELVHFALDEKTRGHYPMWFSEGVALYYEKKYTGFEWRPDLAEKSKEITAEELEYQFQKLPTGLAYRKCYDCILQYVNENGEEALQRLIEDLR